MLKKKEIYIVKGTILYCWLSIGQNFVLVFVFVFLTKVELTILKKYSYFSISMCYVLTEVGLKYLEMYFKYQSFSILFLIFKDSNWTYVSNSANGYC